MADLSQQFGVNTIDEPVSATIMRDVRLVRQLEYQPYRILSMLLVRYTDV